MEDLNKPQYAGFWIRVWASLIDAFCLSPVSLISMWLMNNIKSGIMYPFLNIVINWLLPAIFIISFWKLKSATPGKILTSIRIVDEKTIQPASTGKLILRYFAYFLSFLPLGLGYMWVAFDKKKQGWHDKIAGTLVVRSEGSQGKRGVWKLIISIVIILIVAIGVAIFWTMKNVKNLQKQGDAINQEAIALGNKHDCNFCLQEALLRDKNDNSFVGHINSKIFLSICLKQSGPTQGFCDGVPSVFELPKSISWAMAKCKEVAPDNPNCGKLISEVPNFCYEARKQGGG